MDVFEQYPLPYHSNQDLPGFNTHVHLPVVPVSARVICFQVQAPPYIFYEPEGAKNRDEWSFYSLKNM